MGDSLHPEALAAARTGAGWAFERVFAAFAPAVCGYLRAQGARDPEGETNEVFLRVHRRLPAFEGDVDRFRSWVFAIAHNYVVDQRRWLRRRPVEDVVADTPVRPTGRDAGEEALARVAAADVRALLGTLSPDQRDVLLLRFLADLSIEQTAAATGRTVTGVKALQRRGLDALRRRLAAVSGPAVSLIDRSTFTTT
ncbi:MAG TPA: RNA polymerase sigma factor [Acidimicrobiales bacterium]|nr:RNA polymerase sigma factor [Acidimicrobiales bacterium]